MQKHHKWSVSLVVLVLASVTLACARTPSLLSPPAADDTPTGVPPLSTQVLAAGEDRTLIDLYQRTIPGVVNVRVMQIDADDDLSGSVGSGFVIDRQGHIVTNAHVVRNAQLVDVVLYDDTIMSARVVGFDKHSDLAVLRVDASEENLTPLVLADSDRVMPGQHVVAIGNPFGRQGSMTSGIVSAVGRTIRGLTPFSIPQAIQTDAAINPGNSGGPLLNLRGEVIGVNAQIDSTVRANAGVGFAIPANIVARVVPALIREGRFAWPWLGVEGTSLTLRYAQANELTVTRGAYIVGVIEGSPSDGAGLVGASGTTTVDGLTVPVGGDVVLAVGDQQVWSMDDLILLVSEHDVGDRVTLTVLRDGRESSVIVTLDARPERNLD